MQRQPMGKYHFTDFARERKIPRPNHNNPWIEIKPVSPKGNQPWTFIGRPDLKFQYFGQPDANSWLIGKDPDSGKDWRQKEKRRAEDEMVRWHHRLNGHELEQTMGESKGQGNPVCWSMGLLSQTRLNDWIIATTEITFLLSCYSQDNIGTDAQELFVECMNIHESLKKR